MQEEIIQPDEVLKSQVLTKFIFSGTLYYLGIYIVLVIFCFWQFNIDLYKISIMWQSASFLDILQVSPAWVLVLVLIQYFSIKNVLKNKTVVVLSAQGVVYKQGNINKLILWTNYGGISFASNPMFIKFNSGKELKVLDVFAKEALLARIEAYRQAYQATPALSVAV